MGGGASAVPTRHELPKYVLEIRKYRGKPKQLVPLTCCETLSAAADNKAFMGQAALGLIGELCLTLQSDAGEAREKCLKIILNISTLPTNATELLSPQLSMIPILTSIIKSNSSESATNSAFSIIQNLCANASNVSSVIKPENNLLSALVSVLDSNSSKEITRSAVAVTSALVLSEAALPMIGSRQLGMMKSFKNCLDQKIGGSTGGKILGIIKRLVSDGDEATKAYIASEELGLLPVLVKPFSSRNLKPDSNVLKILYILHNLLKNEANMLKVAAPGNPTVSGILRLVSDSEAGPAARAIVTALAKRSPKQVKLFLGSDEAAVIETASEILPNKSSDKSLVLWCLEIISEIATVPENCLALCRRERRICQSVGAIMSGKSDDLITAAAEFLCRVSSFPEFAPSWADLELLRTVCALVQSSNSKLQLVALMIICNTSTAESLKEPLCSYRVGLLSVVAPILEDQPDDVTMAVLTILLNLSTLQTNQVWLVAPDINLVPKLMNVTRTKGDTLSLVSLKILRNVTTNVQNRAALAAPKAGLVAFLTEWAKRNHKKALCECLHALASLASESAAICDTFAVYDFYVFLVDAVGSSGSLPDSWAAADSAEAGALNLLVQAAQWSASHPFLLGIADTLVVFGRLVQGKHAYSKSAFLFLALLVGSSEDFGHMDLLRSGSENIDTFIRAYDGSDIATSALKTLSIGESIKESLLRNRTLIASLQENISRYVFASISQKFDVSYDPAKRRHAEVSVEILLNLSFAIKDDATLRESNVFGNTASIIQLLKTCSNSDFHTNAKQAAVILSSRLSVAESDQEESPRTSSKSFVAVIYFWESDNHRPEIIECMAVSLRSMDYDVVLIENGSCVQETEAAKWNWDATRLATPAQILSGCSAAVLCLSRGFNDSPVCR
jgi:hypothetical protein